MLNTEYTDGTALNLSETRRLCLMAFFLICLPRFEVTEVDERFRIIALLSFLSHLWVAVTPNTVRCTFLSGICADKFVLLVTSR